MGQLGMVDGDLVRLRNSLAADRLVNLTGPLGSGKTALLTELGPAVLVDLTAPRAADRLRTALDRRAGLVGVDGVDSPAGLRRVRRILATHWHADATQVVVAGRRRWDDVPQVAVRPWPDERIGELATRLTLSGPDERRFVTRMAGGNPLIARSLIAALHQGAPVGQPTVVADHVADVLTTRLATERPGTNWRRFLRVLAGVGFGDQELLDVGENEFAAVAGLSIVTRTRLGLAVDEPYRTILDLSYRWRRPLEHRTTLNRAGVHRIRMLSETSDPELRKDLTLHGLFLTDEPHVRAMFFPPRPALPTIEPADDQDVDDIARLIREWALDSELDVRATDRMTDRWLRGSPEHFHVTRDADGRPAALVHLVPFAAAVAGGVEPVAQQFTEQFLAEPDGTFVITGYWPDEATGAAMLRRIIQEGVDRRHMVVCTPTPAYQQLARAMGVPHFGATRDNTFGTGHATHVFGQHMTPADLPRWMSRLGAMSGHRPPADFLTEAVVRALESIRTPVRLTRSPLLAAPHTGTPDTLRDWLTREIGDLADSDDPRAAEAGGQLRRHYLDRAEVAPDPGLRRGLTVLTDRFRADGMAVLAPAPGPAGASGLDEFVLRLRALRSWAGSPSYAEITRRIERLRAMRGQPEDERRTSRITVYDCFRLGRRRLDIDLVTDIVHALGGTDVHEWRRGYGSITAR